LRAVLAQTVEGDVVRPTDMDRLVFAGGPHVQETHAGALTDQLRQVLRLDHAWDLQFVHLFHTERFIFSRAGSSRLACATTWLCSYDNGVLGWCQGGWGATGNLSAEVCR